MPPPEAPLTTLADFAPRIIQHAALFVDNHPRKREPHEIKAAVCFSN